ncbi:MAG: ATP-binding cassette domain-containing protein [Bacilli bacterium]|nr:ATP-binding cassette domain-containing protein [Bacilli bacterium]
MGFEVYIENVSKKVKRNRYILKDVNLKISKNSFVALVGPSGAGKTSLLNAMSNYDSTYQGKIYFNNYLSKENDLKSQISYVPQREILHKDLTLYQEIYYMAKLRLNKLSKNEINKKIAQVLQSLELEGKKETYIKNLSGGEKRRLSIALELLCTPKVLILDEPTSGLDLNIEKKLMILLKQISQSGTTVIISAHTVSNLELCDQIIFMGNNGSICGMMPYQESFSFFNVTQFVDIYEILLNNPKKYTTKFNENFKIEKKKTEKLVNMTNTNRCHEIFYLAKRYLHIIKNDKFYLFMMLFQGILIACLFNIAVPSDGLKQYDTAKIVLFAITCAAMWLGLFNSVQEIVKERDILKREYMSNVRLSSYILSKIFVLGMICLIESFLVMGTLSFHFQFPKQGLIFQTVFIENVIHFFLISFSSCLLGLCISVTVKKQELTLILAFLYMLVQLIFSGILLSLEGIAKWISYFIIGKYAIYTVGTTSNLIEVVKNTKLNGILPEQVSIDLFLEEAEELFEYTSSHIFNTWGILIIMSLIFTIFLFWRIRKMIKTNN